MMFRMGRLYNHVTCGSFTHILYLVFTNYWLASFNSQPFLSLVDEPSLKTAAKRLIIGMLCKFAMLQVRRNS